MNNLTDNPTSFSSDSAEYYSKCVTNEDNISSTGSNLNPSSRCFPLNTAEFEDGLGKLTSELSNFLKLSDDVNFSDPNMSSPSESQNLVLPLELSKISTKDSSIDDIAISTPLVSQTNLQNLNDCLKNLTLDFDTSDVLRDTSNIAQSPEKSFFSGVKIPEQTDFFDHDEDVSTVSDKFKSTFFSKSKTLPQLNESLLFDEQNTASKIFHTIDIPPPDLKTPNSPSAVEASEVWDESKITISTRNSSEDPSLCRTPHLPLSYKASKFKLWKNLFNKNRLSIRQEVNRFLTPVNRACAKFVSKPSSSGKLQFIDSAEKLHKLSFGDTPENKSIETQVTPNTLSAKFQSSSSHSVATPVNSMPNLGRDDKSSPIKLRRLSADYKTPSNRAAAACNTTRVRSGRFKICVDDSDWRDNTPETEDKVADGAFSMTDLRREIGHIGENLPAPKRRKTKLAPQRFFSKKRKEMSLTPIDHKYERMSRVFNHDRPAIDESIPCPSWMMPASFKVQKSTKMPRDERHKENVPVSSPEREFPVQGVIKKTISKRRMKARDPSPLSVRSYKQLRSLRF